jgi:predicted dehydrogenase
VKLKLPKLPRPGPADDAPPVIGIAGQAGPILLSALKGLADLRRIRLAGLWAPPGMNRGPAADSLHLPPEARFDDPEGLLRQERLTALLVTGAFEGRTETIRKTLERKVHVLTEPPLAGTAAEAESLIDAAAAAGVHLGAIHSARYDALYAEPLWAVREGRIGEVLFVRTEGPGSDALVPDDGATRFSAELYEDIYLARAWAGAPVTSVYARTERRKHRRSEAGFTVLHLAHAGGGASVVGRMNTAGAPSEVREIHGTDGAIRIHRAERAWSLRKRTEGGAEAGPWARNDPGEETLRGGATPEGVPAGTGARPRARALDDAFASFARGLPPPVDGREAWLNLRVLDAARESARTGEAVRVEIPFPR